jgi:hypothetical protein
MNALTELVEEVRSHGFAELAGSRAAADLTIPESLVNRAATAMLADAGGRVRGIEIRVEPGSRFHVKLQLAKSFLPPIGLETTIERQPELPQSPEIVLKWRSVLPGFASIAGTFASFLNVLPEGIRLDGDRIFLDLRPMLARAGFADLLPLLSKLQISTRAGFVDVRVDVNVR